MPARAFIFPLILLAVFSCRKSSSPDCLKRTGEETTEQRFPGIFTGVEANNKAEVTISHGAAYQVEVIAGAHLLRKIMTRVENGILKIEDRNTCHMVRGYRRTGVKVRVTLPYLVRVINKGVATVRVEPGFLQDSIRIQAESPGDVHLAGHYAWLNLYANGNSDIYLSGSCDRLEVFMNGTGFLRAEALQPGLYAFIETMSVGDVYINARTLKTLSFVIRGHGNIYCLGQPAKVSGTYRDSPGGRLIYQD
jgi:hypothetical protein